MCIRDRDGRGVIRVPGLRPPPIPANVRAALQGLRFGGDEGDPDIDADWGEPGLTPGERVIAWNTLEVLAYRTGNPDHPVNAIPPAARAAMHLRFVVGTDVARLREDVYKRQPLNRANKSSCRRQPWMRWATSISTRSPTSWPRLSLMWRKRSRSTTSSAKP